MSYGVRKNFYNSKAWKSVKKYIWTKQNLLCNRCHKPVYVDGLSKWIPKDQRRIGIVHHIEYLNDTNIGNKNISLGEDNLEGLCKDCHEKEHHQDLATRKDYDFDEDGNLIKK